MIVILEGPDAGGKDSIRKELEGSQGGSLLVLVRAWPSLLAYAKYFNREAYRNKKQLDSMVLASMSAVDRIGAVVVHVTASPKILRQRIWKRGEDPVAQPNIEKIEQCFRWAYNRLKLHFPWFLWIDTSDHNPRRCAEYILCHLEDMEEGSYGKQQRS